MAWWKHILIFVIGGLTASLILMGILFATGTPQYLNYSFIYGYVIMMVLYLIYAWMKEKAWI